ACLTPLETNICRGVTSVATPSFSSQVTHGTGSPTAVAPPATDGFSAVRSMWMLSDGICAPLARSWPDGSQRLATLLKRLAKMFVGGPKCALGSYHVTHGT